MSTASALHPSFPSSAWTIRTTSELLGIQPIEADFLQISFKPAGNQMQGMCRFEKGFEQLLPLFKGLISLGKPISLSLIYGVEQPQVFFTFSRSEKQVVVGFFIQIINLLKKEVRFKEILKKVLENKKRFQSEQALLQAALQGKAWD